MTTESTLENLKAMCCTGTANEFQRQLEDPTTYSQLGFEERFNLTTDAEWNLHQTNKLSKLIRLAGFSESVASIEAIEYHLNRRLDKTEILHFATCKYIDEGHHIILSGASGNGKTFIACTLRTATCHKFKKVRYVRLPELLDELNVAKGTGTFKNR